jgi:L-lactate dehydrogenase
MVLIDINRELAEGEVMDMNHGLFFVPPITLRAGDYSDCMESDVIVITAGARQKSGESRLQLVKRNADICRSIVDQILPYTGEAVLLIITNPVDIMTQVVMEHSSLPRFRVFGSGTVLDSARFRYYLSKRCRVDARNVHAYVVGEHGDSEVFLWSQVRMAGTPLEQFCNGCDHRCTSSEKGDIVEAVRNSAYHIIEAKGATNYGVSLAVLKITEALIRDENSVLTVSTWIDGNYGLESVCLSIPCIINRRGVARIIETPLDRREQDLIIKSAEILRQTGKEATP